MTAKTARAYILRQNARPSSSSSGVSSSAAMHLLTSPLRRVTTFQNSSSETVLSINTHLSVLRVRGSRPPPCISAARHLTLRPILLFPALIMISGGFDNHLNGPPQGLARPPNSLATLLNTLARRLETLTAPLNTLAALLRPVATRLHPVATLLHYVAACVHPVATRLH